MAGTKDRRARVRPVLFAALVLLSSCQSMTDGGPKEQLASAVLPRFAIEGEPLETSTLAERMEAENVHGVSVAVAIDGELAWAEGYGVADRGIGQPVTTDTMFQAASLTKPVAALAALKLVDDGVLDLDADVNETLSSWKLPENEFTAERKVTLRHLLSHTAGTTVPGFPGYAREEAVPSVVEILKGDGNTDEVQIFQVPGESYSHSDGGYLVLQLLMTDATGKTFPDLMQELVLGPLEMTHSTFAQPLPEDRAPEAATGHRHRGMTVDGKWYIYPEAAARGLWTTPSDMVKFFLEVQNAYHGQGRVLSQSLAREMLAPGLNNWGLGPAIQGDGKRFGHGGSSAGYRSQFTAFIVGGSGAVVMTNSDNGARLAFEMILTVANIHVWEGMMLETRRTKALTPEQYEALTGMYALVDGTGSVVISYADGQLRASVGGMSSVARELLAESETRFFYRDDGASVEFVLEDGRASEIVINASIRGHRVR